MTAITYTRKTRTAIAEATINSESTELDTDAIVQLWKHRFGGTREDLLENIIEYDGKFNSEDHELNPDSIVVETDLATYDIPVTESETLFREATGIPDSDREVTITCLITDEEFNVETSVIPDSIYELIYENIGDTWYEQYGSEPESQ